MIKAKNKPALNENKISFLYPENNYLTRDKTIAPPHRVSNGTSLSSSKGGNERYTMG